MKPIQTSTLIIWAAISLHAQSSRLVVSVEDSGGGAIAGASVTAITAGADSELSCSTNTEGKCAFDNLPRRITAIRVLASGFAVSDRKIPVSTTSTNEVEVRLRPATFAQEVTVNASRLLLGEERTHRFPGSVDVLDSATLTRSRVFTFDEALRKVAGVYTRGEEGFGLRPNIGIRGLNPTRSSKVLLLEDGIPLSYAPYGDNASYYHPPVDRYEEIEVVKGSGQIVYGPSTVGGVINYVTPPPPQQRSGFLSLTGGNRDYANAHLRYGTTLGATGLLFDLMRKQGQDARENTRSGLNDATFKLFRPVGSAQSLTFKANYYGEDSNLTYSGLREDEYRANPRGNPFRNDFTDFNRYGAAVIHSWAVQPNAVLTTNAYGSVFSRDWWRQSSNSAQRPNRASDATCRGMENLNTTCGIEGRLRDYYTSGIEPRLRLTHNAGRFLSETDFGFRAHFERQDRRQENGLTPTARQGALVESNERKNRAYSGFLQNRFMFGRLAVTPGIRLEHVGFERTNRLIGVTGRTDLTRFIPGVGVAYSASDRITVFTGIHRGFAPPRTEDVINNTTGGVIELDPELSWNYELGARARLARTFGLEATYFRMSFQNQIVPASVAGGLGATLTNGGQTLHEGFEMAGRWDLRSLFHSSHGLAFRSSYTYLPTAAFQNVRYSGITGFGNVPIMGNRVPYAPEYLMTSSVTYMHRSGANLLVEGVFTGGQFGDDLNTINPTPDGQRGRIPGSTLWNATLNYPIEAMKSTLFVTTKNLLDRTFIVDRTRGVLPSTPRLVQIGLQYRF